MGVVKLSGGGVLKGVHGEEECLSGPGCVLHGGPGGGVVERPGWRLFWSDGARVLYWVREEVGCLLGPRGFHGNMKGLSGLDLMERMERLGGVGACVEVAEEDGSAVLTNSVRCARQDGCGELIESVGRWDCVWCSCGEVMTDGGVDSGYWRRAGTYEDYSLVWDGKGWLNG